MSIDVAIPGDRYVIKKESEKILILIMRSRVRFPALPWEFSLKGRIPAVTMVWVDW